MSAPAVHVVDDDDAIRDALVWLFHSRGIRADAWRSAESLLAAYSQAMCGCLVLDVRMDGMSGIEAYDRLAERGCEMPVIFLTGHGDVPLAVAALKKGAYDFIEKPFNDNELANRAIEALAIDAARRAARAAESTLGARLARLTEREREVMRLILEGKYNKVIANELGIAMRTVEVHRSRIFEKLAVRSAVELAQRLNQAGHPRG